MTRPSTRRLVGLAAPLLALFVLSSCGVPVDATAKSIPPIAAAVPATTTPPTTTPGEIVVTIYFVKEGHLYAVARRANDNKANTLLDLVGQTPDNAELTAGISNPLASATPGAILHLASASTTSRLLTVSLPNGITNLVGTELYEAYGEIVYTLLTPANDPGCAFTKVAFMLGGQSWPAFLPSFLSTVAPVTPTDYKAIAPTKATKTC